MTYTVVWFKRDLRVYNHEPLAHAAARWLVLCLYLIKSSIWQQPDCALQHYEFLRNSWRDLTQHLKVLGARLQLALDELTDVLSRLHYQEPFAHFVSHHETGNGETYARDLAVARWCREKEGAWHEWPQHGGRNRGKQVLNDFLNVRCVSYRAGISSPLTAADACSWLSPYIASGRLSMREVVQVSQQQQLLLTSSRDAAFMSRLYLHCHFIQKLESEPEIEWRNLHQLYDGLREDAHKGAYFQALQAGRTGWPMVDACAAMLRETGWLNFRMRAMLLSVASYPLWLHLRLVGLWLARQFLDYEPGIHWSQMPMQAGTTRINAIRIYNPLKPAQEHDSHAVFMRRWLSALQRVRDAWLFEPWQMPPQLQARCCARVGGNIPLPLLNLADATRVAKSLIHSLRFQSSVRNAKTAIVQKHGSRSHLSQRMKFSGQSSAQLQRSLDW